MWFNFFGPPCISSLDAKLLVPFDKSYEFWKIAQIVGSFLLDFYELEEYSEIFEVTNHIAT